MANVKRGLGKSFGQIFGEEKIEKADTVETTEATEIENTIKVETISDGTPLKVNINFVQANPNQPRKNFDEKALDELAESIKTYGIIEPLVVHKTGPVHYEIIAGERRLRAAKIAGLTEVPVIVKEYSDQERKEIALIENIQREDLNAVERALGYKALLDEYGLTQDALSAKIGKSRASIANSLRILTLNSELTKMIRDGILSEGHAKALLSIEDEEFRNKLANRVVEEKLSVRKIEDMIRLEKLANYRKEKDAKTNTEYFKLLKIQIKDVEKQMKSKLNAQLKINPKNEKSGIIEIKYDTPEELDRIYLLINSINP